MKKKRRRKSKVPSAKPGNPRKVVRRTLQCLQRAWKFVAVVGIIVGLVIAFFTLFPRIKVYPNAAMKPERTIASPFVIENGSIFSIRDLRFEYLFRNVESKGPSWHNRSTGTLTATDLPTTTLRGGERFYC